MSKTKPQDEEAASPRQAFVAFTEKTDLKLLRFFLPRGFRHCSVLINDGRHWVSMEALAGHTEIIVHEVKASYDLPAHLRKEGMVVVPALVRRDDKARKPRIPSLITCVESVKRVLGLRQFFVITPSQLYAHLRKESQS